MKNHSLLRLALLPVALILVTTGCPGKKDTPAAHANTPAPAVARVESAPPPLPTNTLNPPSPPAPDPGVPASDPVAEMGAALAAATLDKHEGIATVQQRMDQSIDAQIRTLKAGGANVSLAADEKLDTATEVFAEKLRMLTLASTETWASAKHDTELALQNVRSALAEVLNSPPRQ